MLEDELCDDGSGANESARLRPRSTHEELGIITNILYH